MLEQASDHFEVPELTTYEATARDSKSHLYLRPVLLSCAIASGAAALVYQVIWNRLLLVVFGSTTSATATVVAAFMGGMALGAWMLARYGALIIHPARMYVVFELLIAGYALLFPVLLSSASELYGIAWLSQSDQPLLLGVLRLAVGLLVLALPTFIMGATLPLLLRVLEGSGRSTGLVSRVYGLNALGGAVGAAACGFWLLPVLGSSAATLIAVGLNLVVAASVYLAFRSRLQPESCARVMVTPQYRDRRTTLHRLALVTAGFAAIAYEVVWTRLLILVNGSSTYTFSLVLTIYILGLALGSFWIGKRVDQLRSTEISFAHLQVAVALTAIAGIWLVAKLPYIALDVYAFVGVSYTTSLILNTGTTVLALLPPSFLLGAAFPVAVRMIDCDRAQPFRPFGQAYSWTALGNVIGALAAGAGLIGVMGLQGSIRLLAAVSLAAAIICLFTARVSSMQRNLYLLIVASLLAGLVAIRGSWDTLALTSGVFKQAHIYLGVGGDSSKLDQILGNYKTIYYREGNQSVVTVVERPTLGATPHRMLSIDGKVDASTGADMSTQLLSGYLPVLLHEGPSDVFIIGLASGVTAGAVASDPEIASITIAEIEPAVVDAAREFSAFNQRALDDPRVNLVLDDGRHYLRATRANFDIIISEPSNPWMSGPARLFTREFFTEVQARLNPGGVFAQWVPLYGLSTRLLKAELRTFTDVFPSVALYQISQGDLLIVGSLQPLSRRRLATTLPGWPGSNGQGPEDAGASLITGDKGLRAWLGPGPLNTDDNGLLEFGAPKYLLSDVLSLNKKAVWSAPWQADFGDWFDTALVGVSGDVDQWVRVARNYLGKGRLDRAEFIGSRLVDHAGAKELLGDIALQRNDWSGAYSLWETSGTSSALLKIVLLKFEQGDIATASRFLHQVPVKDRGDRYYYSKGLIHASRGELAPAVADLGELTSGRHEGWMIVATGLREIFRQRLDPSAVVNWGRFKMLLDSIRRDLEREQGQEIMQDLLQEVDSLQHSLLTRAEYRELRLIIQQHIIIPMPVYYRAVALFWLGEYAQAKTNFENYLELLPGADSESRAYDLLILSTEKLLSNKGRQS